MALERDSREVKEFSKAALAFGVEPNNVAGVLTRVFNAKGYAGRCEYPKLVKEMGAALCDMDDLHREVEKAAKRQLILGVPDDEKAAIFIEARSRLTEAFVDTVIGALTASCGCKE